MDTVMAGRLGEAAISASSPQKREVDSSGKEDGIGYPEYGHSSGRMTSVH